MPEHDYVRIITVVKRADFDAFLTRDIYRQVTADDAEIDFTVVGYEDTYVPSRNGDAA
jgi:hypothetical protein